MISILQLVNNSWRQIHFRGRITTMKYFYRLLFAIVFLFFFTACSSANETGNNETHTEHESEVSNESESEAALETDQETDAQTTEVTTNEESTYQEETMPTDYLIYGEYIYLENDTPAILTLDFNRTKENGSLEENMKNSLVESDMTSQNVLSELENVTIENGTEATLVFSPGEMMASMSSTEQTQFSKMLTQISFLYGVEQLYFYVGDEPGISIGQSGDIESMEVDANENRGYYLFPTEETDDPEYHYVTGATAGEEVYDENGELLDLAETLVAMRSVTADNVARQPSINETVEIHHATIDENQAEVSYSIDQKAEWTEEEQNQLENVLQLTALDFKVDELHLINQNEETLTIFPF